MKFTRDEISVKVREALCASLALNLNEVTEGSRLINDLGMDSLDFLDVMFTLEKTFGVPIRDADFDRVLRPDKETAASLGEFLKKEEVDALATLILELGSVKGDIARNSLFSYVTVDTLVRMVERKQK